MKLPKARKRGNSFRIEIMHQGKRISATRDTEKECEQWAMLKLLELKTERDKLDIGVKPNYPLSLLFQKYYNEVGRYQKSAATTSEKIKRFLRDFPNLAEMSIHDITPQILTAWRNQRSKTVSAGTVLRDISLYSAIFTYAQKELFLIDVNPFSLVSKPAQPKSRNRRITDAEIDLILAAHDYERGQIISSQAQMVAWSFLFALETAMRQGEILSIKRSNIFSDYIHLPDTKNGDYRDVPLSNTAKELLTLIPMNDKEFIINLKSNQFRKIFEYRVNKAGIEGLHFHDTRHEAITRMVRLRKIPIEILMKITGHRTASILINTYYNPTASEISAMLN